MSVVLVRVDDRLIHGQVIVGWGSAVSPDRIVLADDQIASSSWERDLYRAGVPPGTESEFVSVDAAARRVGAWEASTERVLILVPDVAALVRLCEGAPGIREVNLGGVHQEGDRSQRLTYLFLTDDELVQLQRLQEGGVGITAQDLPSTAPVPLDDIP